MEPNLSSSPDSLGKLNYFPVYAKGLQLALIAEVSGKPWEGAIVRNGDGPGDWPAVKASGVAPFGQMPFLQTPDGLTIGQSIAIAMFIGHRAGMLGKDDREFALSQMCMAEGEDLYALLVAKKLQRWQVTENKLPKEEVEQLWTTVVPEHFANLERLCGENGFTSTGQTAGEIYLFGVLLQMGLCSPECLSAFPKLCAWFDMLKVHPAVSRVLEGKSPIGVLEQYFNMDHYTQAML